MLLEKIAGAAAARGDDLAAVTAIATKVNAQVRTMGMALTPCTVPHSGEPSFTLADDEMEIGVGIHGEPGRERVKLEPADSIVATLLGSVVEDLPFESGTPRCCSSTGWAVLRRSSSTWPTTRPGSSWRTGASRSPGR